ncbi:outer membrane protein [Fulvivirga imtechensis AK7]|uniref:Outer membrane protein n=1 Tax=Fulvivirga imtechensis AK7 TaxID=1237149 RepID=L8JX86_9BACT|nr:OmpA family protein [Fulvivirga imtechensis]ELR72788.1 outer membrane protein [Fulvivirga imtechensis AK7]
MQKFLPLLLLIFIAFLNTQAQTVQWASEVIDFSSELTPVQYSASQILGKPNVLPAGGENPNAWTPERANKKEFIKVGFETPLQIRQIAIAESYNPSAIFRVFVYDENDTEYLVNTFSPRAVPLKGRMLNVFIEETPYKVKAVKLEMDGAAVPEYYSIDAIAITDSDIPIIPEISIPEFINPEILKERLSENVNSTYKEFKPLLSPDGKTLYFSRKNHPENVGGEDDPEDIWYSELDENGEWKLAQNMGEGLNNAGPNFVSSVTPDGKSVLLVLGNQYLDKGKMAAGVSVSSNASGVWSRPVALNIINDYNYSEKANFFLANNRKVLLMSVMREDSYGGRDLYVSFLQKDSSWSEPMNISNKVNTAGEESSPFLAADDKTLYFSSNGYSGFGASDIFVTKRLDDTWTNWSEPENLGPTINSQYEDLFFNIPGNSEFAYYSQGVSEEDMDIFRVALPVFKQPEPVILVKGKLLDSKTNKPIGAKIIYERLSDGKEIGIAESNAETGVFEILLPAGEIYGIRAEAEGFVAESQNIDLRNYEKDAEHKMDEMSLFLVPIEKESTVVLNNVFFEFDKASLKQESFPELNRVAGLLKERKGLNIIISGHTDSTGPEAYNLGLSERRARSVRDYLVKQGADDARLAIKYFGETKPTAPNTTAEGRRKNRRVEFQIVNE